MKVFIRPARPRDAVSLSEINKKCLAENYSISFWTDILAQSKGKYSYVAEQAKLPIGYILCDGELIISFAVDSKFRGKGVGKLLMQHCLMDVDQVGQSVSLHVDVNNHLAKRLYESMNFSVQERIPDYYSERSTDGFLMVRKKSEKSPKGISIRPVCKLKVVVPKG